jgi:hypothetical protein
LLNNPKTIALLLSVSLLSGCNGTTSSGNSEVSMQSNSTPTNTTSAPTAEAENSPPAAGDAVRVARWLKAPMQPVMDALLTGTLAIANNCLVMAGPVKNAPPTLPIFPDGKGAWDDAKQTFTYEGKVIKIGETLQVGGGFIPSFEWFKEAGQKYYDPGCGTTSYWLAS